MGGNTMSTDTLALRRIDQTFTIRIFAELRQEFPD